MKTYYGNTGLNNRKDSLTIPNMESTIHRGSTGISADNFQKPKVAGKSKNFVKKRVRNRLQLDNWKGPTQNIAYSTAQPQLGLNLPAVGVCSSESLGMALFGGKCQV
jgi:hypothetical protein